MNDSVPPFGLLLDVDGPIASPVTRTVAISSIVTDLTALANAGIPIAFNTGRSDAFLRDVVVAPLASAGLGQDVTLYGICEKGGVWFRITAAGGSEPEIFVDEELALPAEYSADIERLVAERFDEIMFFDHTKRSMVSAEQHIGTDDEAYRTAQYDFDMIAMEKLVKLGFGVSREDDVRPAADGSVRYRVDPTIISTDIESSAVGKDTGADRFLQLLAEDGRPMPSRWYTVGDSRTDYAMAQWLHERGEEVSHVDVRPADGVPKTAYPVLTYGDSIHDDAGAQFLRERASELS
ncbi:hypothetical protein [Mycetocola reblochoni]|uniref:hypothetical protein n=1 Tax=Mycetocola reblochoni TaxID=331618 RepID=UPI001FEB8594|nr:hypothetical protein [Mycetocola reblochoni]